MEYFGAGVIGLLSLAAVWATVAKTAGSARGVRSAELDAFSTMLLAFLFVLGALVSMSVARAFADASGDFFKIFLPTSVSQITALALCAVFARFAKIKLDFKPTRAALKTGALYFFPTLAVLACGACIAVFYKAAFGEDIARQEIVALFAEIGDIRVKIFAVFTIAVLAPIAEETFFRGILYPVFKGAFSAVLPDSKKAVATAASAAVVSVLFSLIHASAYAAAPIFLMGIILVCAYEKSGSLVSPIVAHSLFNAANIAVILIL